MRSRGLGPATRWLSVHAGGMNGGLQKAGCLLTDPGRTSWPGQVFVPSWLSLAMAAAALGSGPPARAAEEVSGRRGGPGATVALAACHALLGSPSTVLAEMQLPILCRHGVGSAAPGDDRFGSRLGGAEAQAVQKERACWILWQIACRREWLWMERGCRRHLLTQWPKY